MDRFGLGAIVPGTAVLDEKGEVVARIMGEARDEDCAARWIGCWAAKRGTPRRTDQAVLK